MVDALVRAVMLEVCGTQDTHHGLVWVVLENNMVLYEDYGRIVGRNPILVQTTLSTVVRIFDRVGINMNLCNTK